MDDSVEVYITSDYSVVLDEDDIKTIAKFSSFVKHFTESHALRTTVLLIFCGW